MTDKTENNDFFDEDIEKYQKKYGSYSDDANDSDFVDELFESSDGTPITDWSMDDINKLINEVDNLPDIEEAGEDFNFDRENRQRVNSCIAPNINVLYTSGFRGWFLQHSNR